MIIDSLFISLIFLTGVRLFGVIINLLRLFRKKSLQYLVLLLGWLVYISGPISVIVDYHSDKMESNTYFPFTGATGVMLLMFGIFMYIREIRLQKLLLYVFTIITVLACIFVLFPELSGSVVTITQSVFLLVMLCISVSSRKLFWKSRNSISFFWLCISLAIGLFHAVGFNLFFETSDISVRFVFTALLNLSLLLFFIYFDWEQTQKDFEKSITEKEILLQEVYHRVQNNLMIISSILRLQADNIEGEDKLEIIRSMDNRISSMAILHEQLYRSMDLTRINLYEYITELLEMIKSGFSPCRVDVNISTDSGSVKFDMNKMIPLGMLINEIVTNSFKHAFRNVKNPAINLSLKGSSGNGLLIEISDNGTGFSLENVLKKQKSTGFIIINALASQLGAELNIHNNHGTIYILKLS